MSGFGGLLAVNLPDGEPLTRPLLEMRGITKEFPGVRALDRVDFVLQRCEIHGLVGANGAGKSTLMKVLGGVFSDYGGTITLDERPVRITSPAQAQALGIAVIHQEVQLVPALSVGENLLLGREPRTRRWGSRVLDRRKLFAQAQQILDNLGFPLAVTRPVSELSVAERQLVQIAKAIAADARVLVMDEPTARLSRRERDELFAIMQRLKTRGTAIVYISHFLEEIFMVTDRVTVLRDGRVVGSSPTASLSRKDLVRMMLGREMGETDAALQPSGRASDARPEVLRVEQLGYPGAFEDVNLSVRAGEIVGIGGLVGSGRTELARAIFGAGPVQRGKVLVSGREVQARSPGDAVRAGIGLIPEDRKQQGLVLVRPVIENASLAVAGRLRRGPFLDGRRRLRLVQGLVDRLKVKAPNLHAPVATLSGGNQQKVVLAKWLAAGSRVLILDQPTAGIDIASKEDIYAFMKELAEAGTAIVVISDDPEELARVCDRILVMRKGRIVRELAPGSSSGEVLASITAEY